MTTAFSVGGSSQVLDLVYRDISQLHIWTSYAFTSVVSLISRVKMWRSSDSFLNSFISSLVPTLKSAFVLRALRSSNSFWKCAICGQIKDKQCNLYIYGSCS